MEAVKCYMAKLGGRRPEKAPTRPRLPQAEVHFSAACQGSHEGVGTGS